MNKVIFLIVTFASLTYNFVCAQEVLPLGKTAVFCFSIYRDANDRQEIQFNDPLIPHLENALQKKGIEVHPSSNTPLVSKEIVEYTLVVEGKDCESGYVYLELQPGDVAKMESVKGLPVFTTVEFSSIHWMLDKEKALNSLKGTDCRYALLTTATAEDQTETIANNKVLSGQRSVRVSIMMNLIDVRENKNIKSFSDELSGMDSNGLRAATRGWKQLIDRAINHWFQ